MLTAQRKTHLLDRLAHDGRLVATELAMELAVSEDTIRRDLRELAAEGRLTRVHGGALPASPTNIPVDGRRGMHSQTKLRLGQAATQLIQTGQIVILDGGTTHLALVAVLPRDLRATIVTHSPAIASALEGFPRVEVILIGGRLFRHSMVALGPTTEAAYARLRADVCFLGVTGLHPDTGLTTGDSEEAALKSTMIGASAEVVVLATPDKIGSASPWTIGPLAVVTTLVSEGERPVWISGSTRHIPV